MKTNQSRFSLASSWAWGIAWGIIVTASVASAQTNTWFRFEQDRESLNPISSGTFADRPYNTYVPGNEGSIVGPQQSYYTSVVPHGFILDGFGNVLTNQFSLYWPGTYSTVLAYGESIAQSRPRTSSWTAEAFFKTDGNLTGFQNLWSIGAAVGSSQFYALFDSNGKLNFNIRDTDGTEGFRNLVTSNRVDDSEWHHIAATFDRDTLTLRLYLDYYLQDTISTYTGGNSVLEDVNASVLISSGNPGVHFKGYTDEFRFMSGQALALNQFLIPEPTAAALLGIGGLLFLCRRRA